MKNTFEHDCISITQASMYLSKKTYVVLTLVFCYLESFGVPQPPKQFHRKNVKNSRRGLLFYYYARTRHRGVRRGEWKRKKIH